jgi:hypothetical protein
MINFSKKSQRLLTFLILVIIIFSVFSIPQNTQAQGSIFGGGITAAAECSGLLKNLGGWMGGIFGGLFGFGGEVPVKEEQERTKEGCLDQIAWVVANQIIEKAMKDTINWINGEGGTGGPKYVQDIEGFLTEIADETIGEFINNSAFGFVCDPFKTQLRLSLAKIRIADTRAECTLSEIVENIEGFVGGNFYDGGWNAWGELVTRSNPYTQYLQAENELNARIRARQFEETKKLDWGSGFKSWEVCPGEVYECAIIGPPAPGNVSGEIQKIPAANEEVCSENGGFWQCASPLQIVTPGSVIEGQLNNVLSSGQERLTVADEFNEIVSALLNRLINDVFSQKGLFDYDTEAREGSGFTTGDDLCAEYEICEGDFNRPPPGDGGGNTDVCINLCELTFCEFDPFTDDVNCNPNDPGLNQCINDCFASPDEPPPDSVPPPDGPPPDSGGGTGNDPGSPNFISNISWTDDSSVGGWDITTNLSGGPNGDGSKIDLNYNKADTWPSINVSGTVVVGNVWIVVWRDGKWRASTWEWLRPGQEEKGTENLVNGSPGIKSGPLKNFSPVSGELYGLVVSTPARNGESTIDERSQVLEIIWP